MTTINVGDVIKVTYAEGSDFIIAVVVEKSGSAWCEWLTRDTDVAKFKNDRVVVNPYELHQSSLLTLLPKEEALAVILKS